jgi:hypothetical protein
MHGDVMARRQGTAHGSSDGERYLEEDALYDELLATGNATHSGGLDRLPVVDVRLGLHEREETERKVHNKERTSCRRRLAR